MQSLFLFSSGDSFLHRLDPRPKFLLVVAVLSYVLLFEQPIYMASAFAAIILVLWVLGGISPLTYWRILLLFTPLIFAVAFLQALTLHPPGSTNLLEIGPIGFSDVGLLLGTSVGLRLATMGLTFMMFSMTTTPKDVGLAIHKLGVPFRYAFLATFGLRFLPLMQEDLRTLQNARAARGDLDVGSRNVFRKLKSLPMSFFPLAANALRMSSENAKALELRGYGIAQKRTTVYDLHLGPSDYLVTALSIVVVAAVVYARTVLGLGQLSIV